MCNTLCYTPTTFAVPREVDLACRHGMHALCAHKWALRVAGHVAGGFSSEWPGDDYYYLDQDWRRDVCAAGAVRYVTVVSSNLTTAVVDGSVRVKF